ncbi:RDD family protein [Nitrososphaera viennensis]|nr:RDD family protein [Nitrososphaera viennensis]UVS69573.1 RDD family protein [Nitrososphaera viennensis]
MPPDPSSRPDGAERGQHPAQQPEIILARWSTRFWAWLVDFLIVNAGLGIIFGILSMPMWLYGFTNPGMMSPMYGSEWWNNGFGGPFSFAISSLVFFAYWTYMEANHNGQSIGKMLLRIKTTDLEGKQANTTSIAISSFGKAFLLPIDVFFGWIFTNDKRQRLLSRAANTIVIRATDDDTGRARSSARYQKE